MNFNCKSPIISTVLRVLKHKIYCQSTYGVRRSYRDYKSGSSCSRHPNSSGGHSHQWARSDHRNCTRNIQNMDRLPDCNRHRQQTSQRMHCVHGSIPSMMNPCCRFVTRTQIESLCCCFLWNLNLNQIQIVAVGSYPQREPVSIDSDKWGTRTCPWSEHCTAPPMH